MSNGIVSAVKWSAIGTIARFALQLIAQVILARILGPQNYGLFGIGMVVYTFGNFFSSFGFGRQLLQKQQITDKDIRFAFTWQVCLGALATLIILISAPWIAAYFNEPKVLPVIQWLSLACLLNAATAPASNLLQRDFNFKKIAQIQFIAYGIGYFCLGIPLALAGFGVYALVSAWMAQSLIILVATYLARPHALKPLFWFTDGRDAFNYGGIVFVTNIVNWLLTNLDRIVIGRLLSMQSVGFYTASYNLATMPNNLLLNGFQTIFLTSGAKVSADSTQLAEDYQRILATIFVLVLPLFVFLAVLAPQIIALLYGSQWIASGEVLGILFLGMPALIVWGLSTPVLWNTERRHLEFALQIPILIAGATALFTFAHHGISTVAWIVSAICLLRAVVIAIAAIRALGFNAITLSIDLMRGLLVSVVAFAVAYSAIILTTQWHTPLITLAVSALFAAVVWVLVLFFAPSLLGQRTHKVLCKFIPKLGEPQ